ncbi:MAG TPA: MFS transporter [Burkholderiales bacterium]|nr:MFS transporter [Burkholderiales bacterium]
MAVSTRTAVPSFGSVTAALTLCLVASLAPLMSFPAVLPQVSSAWQLSASEAGWIGGIYFAGYALAVPFLSGWTDRIDGRWVLAGSSLLGAAAGLAFAQWANGFWMALALRFVGGMAFAGVHMPGLTLLTQYVDGPRQGRAVSIYTSSYALGSSGSFLIAGIADAMLGWRAVFVVSAVGPLIALAAVACLAPPPTRARVARLMPDFRSVFRDRAFMRYVLAFAGNTWEVFGIRVWFVACLAWTLSLPGNRLDLPNVAVIAAVASLAGLPASVLVAELASRWNRSRVIIATCLVSVGVCIALAATAGGKAPVVLALLILLQITSFADVGALGVGAVGASTASRRGASMAVYALAGFTSGFLAPVVMGVMLDLFGGSESASGWTAAFLVMAIGSSVTALAMWSTRVPTAAKYRR